MENSKYREVQLPSGEKVLMSPNQEGQVTEKSGKWLGHFYVFTEDSDTGGMIRRHKSFVIASKSAMGKGAARQKLRDHLHELLKPPIVPPTVGPGDPPPGPVVPPSVKGATFKQFIDEVFIPVKKGLWGPVTKGSAESCIETYLTRKFGDRLLSSITFVELQIYFNELGEKYAKGLVDTVLKHARSIFGMARKTHYIDENPADESLKRPRTIVHPKKIMAKEQLARLIMAIPDVMSQCLIALGSMCLLRTSEVFGLTWKSWKGNNLEITGIAWHGELFEDHTKTPESKSSVTIPDKILPYLENWHALCPDTSPDALMFPHTPKRGKSKGCIVPFYPSDFMDEQVYPIADKLGIPRDLVGFRVLRRTGATHLQNFATVKELQSSLRHSKSSSATITMDVYVQPVEENTRRAVNSRTDDVFNTLPSSRELDPSAMTNEDNSVSPSAKADDDDGKQAA